jgi:dTMP kinase
MGLPAPDLVMYMDVDIETALKQIRLRKVSTNGTADIHENDEKYLIDCLRAGSMAAGHLGWRKISCIEGGLMRSIEDIHEDVFKAVREVL